MGKKVELTIDGRLAEASPDDTILAAAGRLGIDIPTLCYMEGKRPTESCGVCMVEIEGREGLHPACATRVSAGMTVRTDVPEIRLARRQALELLLSDHAGDCAAPCEAGCPAHIDIPRVAGLVAEGGVGEAVGAIRERLAFPAVVGRICPAVCEKVCRRRLLDEPLAIRRLERHAADLDRGSASHGLPRRKAPTGKKVAIVGAGVAGLTAAYYLLRDGHGVTVFDDRARPGGALRLIPAFRLPAEVLDAEVELLGRLGAAFRADTALGRDVALEELERDYDAVLLAIGASREEKPEMPGAEHARSAYEFLDRIAAGNPPHVGGTAVVLGSGRGGLDACRVLLRLGAEKVTLVPDRPLGAMSREQAECARAEGVEIVAPSRPREIESLPGGRLRAAGADGSSREVDEVYFAGELRVDIRQLAGLGLATTDRGLKVHSRTLSTSRPGVFAAGAVVRGGGLAVHSSASGRRAAESISAHLAGGSSDRRKLVNVRLGPLSREQVAGLYRDVPKTARRSPQRTELSEVVASFDEVEAAFSEKVAAEEAARCLRCDCSRKNDCRLRILATEYGADPGRYGGAHAEPARETSHEEVVYEPAKCIRCGRCVLIAEDLMSTREAREWEALGVAYIGRGFQVRVGVPFGETMKEGLTDAALRCAEACPTGALSRRRRGR